MLKVHGDGRALQIEFSDELGQALSFLALPPEQFIVIGRAQEREWAPLAERIVELITRLPAPAGTEVLDFARFLSVRTHQRFRPHIAHVSVTEAPVKYHAQPSTHHLHA